MPTTDDVPPGESRENNMYEFTFAVLALGYDFPSVAAAAVFDRWFLPTKLENSRKGLIVYIILNRSRMKVEKSVKENSI